MEVVNKSVNVYVTKDGREFVDKAEAESWEEGLNEMTYFLVHYAPDCTEGRTYSQRSGIIQVVGWGSEAERVARFACEKAFGGSLDFVMGVFGKNAIMPNFSIVGTPCDKDFRTLDVVLIVQEKWSMTRVREKGGIYHIRNFPEKVEEKIY